MAAESGASNGDTINVSTGTYNESNPTFYKQLSWVAIDGTGTVTVTNSGAGAYIINPTSATNLINWTGFVFDGLTTKTTGVYVNSSVTNKQFYNCSFKNVTTTHASLSSANPGWLFSGCTFDDSPANFYIITTSPVTVTASSFPSFTKTTVLSDSKTSGTTYFTNNTVTINSSSASSAISCGGTGNNACVVTGNTVTITASTGAFANCSAGGGTGATCTTQNNRLTAATVNGPLAKSTGGNWIHNVLNNTISITTCSLASYDSVIKLQDQVQACTISGNSITTQGSAACTHIGVKASNATPNGAHSILGNTLSTQSTSLYNIVVGTDAPSAGDGSLPGITISGNTITGPSSGSTMHAILYGYSNNGFIEKNKVTGTGDGIVVKGKAGNTWTGGTFNRNTVSGASLTSAWIKGMPNVASYNNTFADTATNYVSTALLEYSINSDAANAPATGGTSENNIFYLVHSGSVATLVDAGSTTGFTADNNDTYLSGSATTYGSVNGTAYTAWSGGGSWQTAGFDTHGTNLDPKFSSPTDFHLQAVSPAVCAGTNLGLTTDSLGMPWRCGSAKPDIGAYSAMWKMKVF